MAAVAGGDLGAPLRRVKDLVIRPSVDIGRLAREHAERRVGRLRRGTLASRLLRRAASDAEAASDGAADLASYLLFDRDYAADLVALGRQDARQMHAELLEFFGAAPEADARAG